MTSGTKLHIIANPVSAQFEAVRDDEVVGLLAYNEERNHFDLRHTFVPRKYRGQQIARILVAGALNRIGRLGGTITPTCTYVAAFVEQHPDYADLVSPDSPPRLPTVTPRVRSDEASPLGAARAPDTLNVYPDTIVTRRLTLRPWTLDDTDDALGIYGDPQITRWTRPFINPISDRNTMRRQLDRWIAQSDHLAPPQGRWAMELTATGALVGGAHLLQLPTEDESRLVMSWELATFATGHGLATEAGHALAHSAFAIDPTLPAVYALNHPGNDRATATLERVGLHPLPGTQHHHGAELTLHAVTRNDFEAAENTPRIV